MNTLIATPLTLLLDRLFAEVDAATSPVGRCLKGNRSISSKHDHLGRSGIVRPGCTLQAGGFGMGS